MSDIKVIRCDICYSEARKGESGWDHWQSGSIALNGVTDAQDYRREWNHLCTDCKKTLEDAVSKAIRDAHTKIEWTVKSNE